MKLKLQTTKADKLISCLSHINNLRKNAIIRFEKEKFSAISINQSLLTQEPQIWCGIPMDSVFDSIEIQSMRDNTISLEVNIDLFLQALRNFDKSSSDCLYIRLQKGEDKKNSRSACLAFNYSDIPPESNSTISHIFRIPVKLIKSGGVGLKEPVLSAIDLIVMLPNEFSATYRRLDKFKARVEKEKFTVSASQRNGGTLRFLIEEEDNCRTTIKWNDKLEIRTPSPNSHYNSLKDVLLHSESREVEETDRVAEASVSVELKDWLSAAKIVSVSSSVALFICDTHSCAILCSLDESEEAEVTYYISGLLPSHLVSD